MNSLIHLIYASEASPTFREHEIPDLLKSIRPANAKRGITGMLLFTGGSFLQMLEGDAERIDELYARLAGDERHARLTQIVREPIQGRLFGDWSMDFAAVDPTDGAERMAAGHETDTFTGISPVRAKRLFAKLWAPSWQKARSQPRTAARAG